MNPQDTTEPKVYSPNVLRALETQRKRKSSGLCLSCGEPAVNKCHCEYHRQQSATRQRNKYRLKNGIRLDCPDMRKNRVSREKALRELMLAVEFMRSVCEHANGKNKLDDQRLALAMRVGIRTNAKFAKLLPDYQQSTFWQEVRNLPASLGLSDN